MVVYASENQWGRAIVVSNLCIGALIQKKLQDLWVTTPAAMYSRREAIIRMVIDACPAAHQAARKWKVARMTSIIQRQAVPVHVFWLGRYVLLGKKLRFAEFLVFF